MADNRGREGTAFGHGILGELRFFISSQPNLETSYGVFQRPLEGTFGLPTLTSPGSEGFSLAHLGVSWSRDPSLRQ
jgi:hypothetical protein